MVETGKLLGVAEAEYYLEACSEKFDDVTPCHFQVFRKINLPSSFVRVVYGNADVSPRGRKIGIESIGSAAFDVESLTAGGIEIFKISLLAFDLRATSLARAPTVVGAP